MRGRASRVPFFVAGALGILLFAVTCAGRGVSLSDLLFSLSSGCLIVGLVRLLGNMKMFASLNWGTRLLKRVFRNRVRGGQAEREDYVAYRRSCGGHEDALPLLVASGVLAALSFAVTII